MITTTLPRNEVKGFKKILNEDFHRILFSLASLKSHVYMSNNTKIRTYLMPTRNKLGAKTSLWATNTCSL